MDSTDLVTPISLSDGDKVELGGSDGTLDGSLDFLVQFPSQTDVLLCVTDNDESFESGSLTGLSLLLDGLDLHDFFLQWGFSEEGINDFLFLDGDGESEDIGDVFDEFGLDESTELGDWLPFSFTVFLSILVISGFSVTSLFVSSSAETSLLLSFGLGCLLLLWWLLISH